MFSGPTIFGLVPLIIFVVLVFRKWNPVVSIFIATIVGAVMAGASMVEIATTTKEGLGSFLAYVGLIIMAGAGLGKIAEKTGVAQKIVEFVMNKIGIDSANKAILGTMASSTILSGSLGTLSGANAVTAPVVIPIVSKIGLSSSAVAVIFQGAGVTGLFLGPFTPPMVTLMEITGLSYFQVVLYAGLPVSIVMWIVTFFYVKWILPKTIQTHPYTKEDVASFSVNNNDTPLDPKVVARATWAFVISLVGLIVYGVITQGGSTFALVVIIGTAIITGLAAKLSPNEIADTFFEGAKPLIWLFFQFILFTPFIFYIQELGGFESLKNMIMPLIDKGGNLTLVLLTSLTGIAGVPGAAVAQSIVLNEMFGSLYLEAGIPISIWVLVLLVGSQMTEFLYPVGDTLASMGIARSKDLKTMVVFGIVITVFVVLFVGLRSLII
ncbi:Na+/H+ antiporter NhaC family protein [Sporosarcina siberiensis]|uniref:Na+/H+ antiporter NhaC family protein n=1 Tax=Sporosarcina siberiensis TaxID=1365606 RepID=A0ABW4SJZ5_9BACL